jgi:hypothetical protein
MPVLFDKSGAEGTYRRFKFEILKIIQHNDLPGFSLAVVPSDAEGEPLVHMVKREYVGEGGHQEWKPPSKQSLRPRPVQAARTATDGDLPLLSPIIRTLSERTIVSIRNECPGWDIYALQAAYNEWLDADPSRMPANYEAAFQGWVRQHHARNRSQVSGSRS